MSGSGSLHFDLVVLDSLCFASSKAHKQNYNKCLFSQANLNKETLLDFKTDCIGVLASVFVAIEFITKRAKRALNIFICDDKKLCFSQKLIEF